MTNRHEFDGRPYREVSLSELFVGREWIGDALWAVVLVVLFAISGFLDHLESLAVCFMVDYHRVIERRHTKFHAIGNPPHALVSLIVTIALITAPLWAGEVFK